MATQYGSFPRLILATNILLLCLSLSACGKSGSGGSGGSSNQEVLVVNSLEDLDSPPLGTVTLRSAIAEIGSGGKIIFDPLLNGGTIRLTIIGESHSILKGEVYNGGVFAGYQERDYGKSAIYAKKNLDIDASSLPDGITIMWDGGDANPARVMAVYGDLKMNNITITSGFSSSEPITAGTQPFTLGRGGGLAVWGTATLNHCTLSGNRTLGDTNASRDRGSFGGGTYGNLLILNDSVISGNWAKGYGAAGGGVYSVGGQGMINGSALTRCTISGNRVTAQHAYGAGVFSEGGGPGDTKTITITNCTIARNRAEDNPEIPETSPTPPPPQYYYRGGGFYMTNGSVAVRSCTIVENRVTGNPATFSGKPNMGGGGIAATIGNAHVVENMDITHSIIAGNLVNGSPDDVYSGSLLQFYSHGYNRIGKLNFDQILVPIPTWWSLSRKHWPKQGDQDGVDVSEVLALDDVKKHPAIISDGTDQGDSAVLWYPAAGSALDQIPSGSYSNTHILGQYTVDSMGIDDFLAQVLDKVRDMYGFGPEFGDSLEYIGVTWQGTDGTWPSKPENAKWIKFWRDLDIELGNSIGTVKLGDEFWGSFSTGPLGLNINMSMSYETESISLIKSDQMGASRPKNEAGDIGAIEN